MEQYLKHEDAMFSLYNYTQAMNTESDAIDEQCLKIESDIEKYQQTVAEQNQLKFTKMHEMETKLVQNQQMMEDLSHQISIQRDSVEQLSKKIQSMFYKLQCDQLLLESKNQKQKVKNRLLFQLENKIVSLTRQTASETNVLEFSAAIEQRAVDIINDYELSTRKNDRRSPSIGPSSPAHLPAEYLTDGVDFGIDDWMLEAEDSDKPVDLNALKATFMKKAQRMRSFEETM